MPGVPSWLTMYRVLRRDAVSLCGGGKNLPPGPFRAAFALDINRNVGEKLTAETLPSIHSQQASL
ncbi:hypothetical protein [Candidatus Electronema sp. JC]|uniref:hypothetical protein n=1 Tax=Candidatus Electronema sp. JC TaxID=3401570 RepID=UPI003B4309AA